MIDDFEDYVGEICSTDEEVQQYGIYKLVGDSLVNMTMIKQKF